MRFVDGLFQRRTKPIPINVLGRAKRNIVMESMLCQNDSALVWIR